jgi:hypothetical protein
VVDFHPAMMPSPYFLEVHSAAGRV